MDMWGGVDLRSLGRSIRENRRATNIPRWPLWEDNFDQLLCRLLWGPSQGTTQRMYGAYRVIPVA